MKTVKTVT